MGRTRIEDIPVEHLRVSRANPRRGAGDVAELAASMRRVGVLEPLVVMPDGDGSTFVVLAGQRRLAAAKRAGLEDVPCVVRPPMAERDAEILMLTENVQREDLSPIETASVYVRLMRLHEFTQAQVAEAIGVSGAKVSIYLALLRLPASIVRQVDAGEMSISEALGMGGHRDPTTKPLLKARGLGVSLHRLSGHERCRDGCEVVQLARSRRR